VVELLRTYLVDFIGLPFFFLYEFSEKKFIENGKDSYINFLRKEIETLKAELRMLKDEEIVEDETDDKTDR
jgi:hypothetical protein